MSKVIAIIGGVVGIVAAILGFLAPELGWWQVTAENYLIIFDGSGYINAFGMTSNTVNEEVELLGNMFLIGGIVFIVGALLAMVGAAKESTGLAVLGSIIMIAGIGLWVYDLMTNEDFENIIDGLDFITGDEYTVLFGAIDLGILGAWNWGLGVGFYIAVAGAVVCLIGSFMVKR